MKYWPACILLACACIVDMHVMQSVCCLITGVLLTLCALGVPDKPLIYNAVVEVPDPSIMSLFNNGNEDEDESPPKSDNEFDYD